MQDREVDDTREDVKLMMRRGSKGSISEIIYISSTSAKVTLHHFLYQQQPISLSIPVRETFQIVVLLWNEGGGRDGDGDALHDSFLIPTHYPDPSRPVVGVGVGVRPVA